MKLREAFTPLRAEVSFESTTKTSKRSVFVGYLDHCGHFSGLSRGFRELGVPVYFLNLGPKDYEISSGWTQKDNFVVRNFRAAYKCGIARDPNASPAPFWVMAWVYLSLLALIAWICLRFNTVILNSGISLSAKKLDVKLFKLFGLKIVSSFHGSDSRPNYINGGFLGMSTVDIARYTLKTKSHVVKATENADIVVDNPLCSHFHTKRVCVYQAIGIPVSVPLPQAGDGYYSTADGTYDTVRCLHAPSNPVIKGSDIIKRTMQELIAGGLKIEYIEVTGVPHAEVIDNIRHCDIVIDELYSDMHGAALAMEALMLGRPVLVCGFGEAQLNIFTPPDFRAPSVFSRPECFQENLVRLIKDPALRRLLGLRGGEYAKKCIVPRSVAGNLLKVIEGQAPDDWFFDPRDIRYVDGIGAPAEAIRAQVRRYVLEQGISALCLDDKADLRSWMLTELGINPYAAADVQ
jgi:hypothetical protein